MNFFAKTPIFFVLAAFLFLGVIFLVLSSKPADFPVNEIITIEKGSSVLEIGRYLEKRGVINSVPVFVTGARLFNSESDIKYGNYLFKKPASVVGVLRSLITGLSDLERVKITIPEGLTIKDVAGIFTRSGLPSFNQRDFLLKTKGLEGYLFPDTYFFYDTASLDEMINALRNNFSAKTEELAKKTAPSRPFEEIIIMASIIEKEVRGEEDRKIVSGILWKRIEMGMALQVDATLDYILNKTSAELTVDDLKIKSPYNTYLYPGLPPAPICNPGLSAITASMYPEETDYLFYLTGKDGKTYFAKNFEEHKANKEKYLR